MELLKPLAEQLDIEVNNIKFPKENQEVTVYCPVTNEKLYTLNERGYAKLFAEQGICSECGIDYHVTHLRTSGMSRCKWPVRYKGYTCKSCWPEKPST